MDIVVDEQGRLTLEELGVTFWLRREEIDALATIPPRKDEVEQYADLHNQLYGAVEKEAHISRRVVVVNPRWCPTYLQLLRGRNRNTLMAVFRSLDSERLPSDLGFVCREAKAFGCDQVVVSIGSLHLVLGRA